MMDCLTACSSVAITSDIWNGNAKGDYLSLVAHFVNSDWELEKKLIGLRLIDVCHSSFMDTHYRHTMGQSLLTDDHWSVAEKILLFLELFYESTLELSGVYYPTSLLMLHHLIDIASHLNQYETYPLLRTIVLPMKDKFSKYWKNIPMLYSFAFVFDPRAKMRGFHKALTLISNLTSNDYANYYDSVHAELTVVFTKYDLMFGGQVSHRK
jgi:hypothetical protein